jgi:hypothetical protein
MAAPILVSSQTPIQHDCIPRTIFSTPDVTCKTEKAVEILHTHLSNKAPKIWEANHIQSFIGFQARVPGSGFWFLFCHVSSYFVI